MNSSFLDRSMDTINYNNPEFLDPQFQSNYTNKSKKEYLEKKGNGHLDRVFDQTAINPHFAGLDEKQMKLSFRPTSSFDIEQEMKMQKPNIRQNYQQKQQPSRTRSQPNKVTQVSCQYCDSYRKKNMNNENMIYKLQKEVGEKGVEINKVREELKTRDKSGFEIRREHDKLQNQLKQKNTECEVLEKKIMSIQLEKQEKNMTMIEKEVQKVNDKYYKMIEHYESTIGSLRKEVIELTQNSQESPKQQQQQQQEQPIIQEEIKIHEIKNPLYDSLVSILCKKLDKTKEDIELKLKDYPIPEKITADSLNKILNLYK
jgi:chromosome segregation ATPase